MQFGDDYIKNQIRELKKFALVYLGWEVESKAQLSEIREKVCCKRVHNRVHLGSAPM